VERCKESGLKQDRFTFIFNEDGTTVFGQYFYGEESLQIYAPTPKVPIKEKSTIDLSEEEYPKTFYVNTSKGYYWVEVRYVEGAPVVYLTKFSATVPSADGMGVEYVYPGIELAAPGMITGTFGDAAQGRYVLSQNGGVLVGTKKEKGTIISTPIIDAAARITIATPSSAGHAYVLMVNSAKAPEVRYVTVSYLNAAFNVVRRYLSLEMSIEGETNIPLQLMLPNPCWVHRKCTGSYFSPNKTIGYHVDIGTDDDFWGNISALGGGLQDKLDNTGGAAEPLFNHTKDLYRMMPFAATPIFADEEKVSFIVCSPTMFFQDDGANSKKCWGGYGLTQSWAGCVDYMGDFDRWMLAPKLIQCDWDVNTGERSFTDFAVTGNAAVAVATISWDGAFIGKFRIETEYECDTKFYSEMVDKEAGYCEWDEEIEGNCDPSFDPVGYSGIAAKSFVVMDHWAYYSRENIKNIKKVYF
jgi:hypothetical protein